MGIHVEWGSAGPLVSKFSARLGQRTGANQGLAQQLELERSLLSRDDTLRQQGFSNALAAQQLDDQNRQHDQAIAAELYGKQQQLAARQYDAQEKAALDSQNFDQQAALADFQQQNVNQRQANDFADRMDRDSIDSMEKNAGDALNFATKMDLSPEGKRRLQELNQSLRAVQGGVGVQYAYGSNAHREVLGQWLNDYQRSGLQDFEQQPLTAEGVWGQETYKDELGNVYGLDRNNKLRPLRKGIPQPLSQDEIATNTYPLQGGGSIFINPRDGKLTQLHADPNAGGPKMSESLRLRKQAVDELMKEKEFSSTGDGAITPPTDTEVASRIQQILDQIHGHAPSPAMATGVSGHANSLPSADALFGGSNGSANSVQQIPNFDPNEPPQYGSGTYDPSQPARFDPMNSGPPAWYLQLRPGDSYTAPDGTTRIKGQ